MGKITTLTTTIESKATFGNERDDATAAVARVRRTDPDPFTTVDIMIGTQSVTIPIATLTDIAKWVESLR